MQQRTAPLLGPGATIADRYRLERIVGAGGMGVVWAARDLASGAPVAVKLIKDATDDPRERERLLREASAAMRIAHPGVARVFAAQEDAKAGPFIVMELLEGESLRSLLERRGTISVPECASIVAAVAAAIDAAHAQGLVHRDLKPENVFLASAGIKVLDLGIAKPIVGGGQGPALPSLTSTGTVVGTPTYMSPEQVFGDPLDGASDVWSLGIVLYECLSGRRPTDADTLGQILKRVTDEPIPPLARLRPDLPPSVTSMVDRMLSRQKAARPSLVEVASILQGAAAAGGAALLATTPQPMAPRPPIASTVPITAPMPAPARAPAPPPSGSSAVWILAPIALVVVGGAGGGVAYWRLRAPSGSGVGGDRTAAELTAQIQSAMVQRRGADCVKNLDALDAIQVAPTARSTSPTSGWASARATCTMLAGDCEGGKAMLRKLPNPTTGGTYSEPIIDAMTGEFCEGDRLTPRDKALVAVSKLGRVSGKLQSASPADCQRWGDAIARAPTPMGDEAMKNAKLTGKTMVPLCFAAAGDCKAAFRTYRDANGPDYGPSVPPDVREASLVQGFDVTFTTCAGKR